MSPTSSLNENQNIKVWQDRIRILFILYYFSEVYTDDQFKDRKKIFQSEVRLVKLDFLVRNPDYLCYFLLQRSEKNEIPPHDVESLVTKIFKNKEPEIRKNEMERFLYGAYEELDNVIAFLCSFGLLEFESRKDTHLRDIQKKYFITNAAIKKFDKINNFEYLSWYRDRCLLIKKYFGDYSGETLKNMQHSLPIYHNTALTAYIPSLEQEVKEYFEKLYHKPL